MSPRLRLFTGEETPERPVIEPEVRVRLGDVLPVLHEALLARRSWLNDFADDEVGISADLYEVLATYLHLRPSA